MSPPRFRRSGRILRREAGADVVLFDPLSDALHVLNPTSAFVWGLLAQARTSSEIGESLAARFAPGRDDDVTADVARLLAELECLGLVERSPA